MVFAVGIVLRIDYHRLHNQGTGYRHFHRYLRSNAANLSHGFRSGDSLCDYGQPGVGTDGTELPQRVVSTGVPGFSPNGVCGNLLCADTSHSLFRQHTHRHMDVCCLHGAFVFLTLPHREPQQKHIRISLDSVNS